MKKWTKHEEEANVVCLIIMRKTIAIHYDKDMINEVWLYGLLLLKVYEEPCIEELFHLFVRTAIYALSAWYKYK